MEPEEFGPGEERAQAFLWLMVGVIIVVGILLWIAILGGAV